MSLFLCSCSEQISSRDEYSKSNNNISPTVNSTETQTFSSAFGENIVVNADTNNIQVLENQIYSSALVKKKSFNINKICSIFFGNSKPKIRVADDRTICTLNDKQLNVGDGDLQYQTELSRYLLEFITIDDVDTKNIDHFQSDSLNFMPKQDAIFLATKFLNELGIEQISTPQVYALDAQTLQQEQNLYLQKIQNDEWLTDLFKNGKITLKDQWGLEDECYYIFFNVTTNDLPMNTDSYVIQAADGFPVDGTCAKIIISKNGISYCDIGIIYDKISQFPETFHIITLNEALSILSKRYNQIILIKPIQISHIRLVYCALPTEITRDSSGKITSQEYTIVPTWTFKGTKEATIRGEIVINNITLLINAKTGEFIL